MVGTLRRMQSAKIASVSHRPLSRVLKDDKAPRGASLVTVVKCDIERESYSLKRLFPSRAIHKAHSLGIVNAQLIQRNVISLEIAP